VEGNVLLPPLLVRAWSSTSRLPRSPLLLTRRLPGLC